MQVQPPGGDEMNTLSKTVIIFILAVLLFPIVVMAGPVPDTGQTKCYDDSGEITCPQPGEAFYGQDAQYTINPPSYTKLVPLAPTPRLNSLI